MPRNPFLIPIPRTSTCLIRGLLTSALASYRVFLWYSSSCYVYYNLWAGETRALSIELSARVVRKRSGQLLAFGGAWDRYGAGIKGDAGSRQDSSLSLRSTCTYDPATGAELGRCL